MTKRKKKSFLLVGEEKEEERKAIAIKICKSTDEPMWEIHYCGRNHFFVEWFLGKSLLFFSVFWLLNKDDRQKPQTGKELMIRYTPFLVKLYYYLLQPWILHKVCLSILSLWK